MTKKTKLDKFHYHEVIDRINIIQNNIQENVIDHPAVQGREDLISDLDKAMGHLYNAYNKACELYDREVR